MILRAAMAREGPYSRPEAPDEFRAIVNVHFRSRRRADQPAILGVVNGLRSNGCSPYPDRLSVTISSADRLIDRPREDLAAEIWREVAALDRLPLDPPPWQIVKEKRATFAATPAQNAKRPHARTRWAMSCSPATGPRPACPPRSKARCVQV